MSCSCLWKRLVALHHLSILEANLRSGFGYKSVAQWACGLILHVAFSDHWLFPSINLFWPEADLCFCFSCSSVLSKQDCRTRHFLPVAFCFSLNHSCFPPHVVVCILWYVLSQKCCPDARTKIFGVSSEVCACAVWIANPFAWTAVCTAGPELLPGLVKSSGISEVWGGPGMLLPYSGYLWGFIWVALSSCLCFL